MSDCFHKQGISGVQDADCIFCDAPRVSEICVYCNTVHEFVDFGYDLQGNQTLICADQLNDALWRDNDRRA